MQRAPDVFTRRGWLQSAGSGLSAGAYAGLAVPGAAPGETRRITRGFRISTAGGPKVALVAEAGMGQGEIARMNLAGNRLEECIRPFQAPPNLRYSAV